MKLLLRIMAAAALLIALPAFAQSTSTLYARSFPGTTVGAKVAAAQNACTAGQTCIIVIGPALASYPEGTMPAKCAQCVWEDLRTESAYVPRAGGTMTGPLAIGSSTPVPGNALFWGTTSLTYDTSPNQGQQSIYTGFTSAPSNYKLSLSSLASYASIGSVSQYIYNKSSAPFATLTGTTFTATSVTSASLSGVTVPTGMVLEADAGCDAVYPTEPCVAYEASQSGTTLTTTSAGWVVVGHSSVTVTPAAGTEVQLNPSNSIFGQNIVMNLSDQTTGATANVAVGQEIDLESQYSGTQSLIGSQVVNDGVPQMQYGYYANGNVSHFADGFYSNSNVDGFSANAYTGYGFAANIVGAGIYPFAYENFGTHIPKWFVDNSGNVFASGEYGFKGVQLSTPSAPTYTVSSTGGSLGPGTLNYCVAAQDASKNWTPCSTPVAVTLAGSTNEITFAWSSVPGAVQYVLYLVSNGSHYLTTGTSYTVVTTGGTGFSPPSTNQTGGVTAAGPISGPTIRATNSVDSPVYEVNGSPLASSDLSDSASLVHFVGSLTTTANSSDRLTNSSVPARAACSVTARNSAAAGLTGVYVPLVVTAGRVVVHHSATAGGIFSVFCQY